MEKVFEWVKIGLMISLVIVVVVGIFVVRGAVQGAVETAEQTIASDLNNEDSALSKAIDGSAYRAGAEVVNALANGIRYRNSPLANRARGMLRTTVIDFADELDDPESVLAGKVGKIIDHYGIGWKAFAAAIQQPEKPSEEVEERKPEEEQPKQQPEETEVQEEKPEEEEQKIEEEAPKPKSLRELLDAEKARRGIGTKTKEGSE